MNRIRTVKLVNFQDRLKKTQKFIKLMSKSFKRHSNFCLKHTGKYLHEKSFTVQPLGYILHHEIAIDLVAQIVFCHLK